MSNISRYYFSLSLSCKNVDAAIFGTVQTDTVNAYLIELFYIYNYAFFQNETRGCNGLLPALANVVTECLSSSVIILMHNYTTIG